MLSSGHPLPPTATREEGLQLAASLPDDPLTVNLRSALRSGRGTLYLDGPAQRPRGAVIVYPWAPAQPQGLGTNPKAIAGLLRKIPGWFCVNVSLALGPPLSRELEVELGVPTQLSGDLYYVLDRPPALCRHPAVRLLSEIDAPLVQGAPAELREGGDIWVQRPAECVAAGGVVEGRLVGIMVAFAFSEKFAELGGATLEPFRQQGIGSAAAFLVSQEIRARHRTPVWSTGEDNFRSQRVAEKLGFREFGRLNYVVVPRLKETGGFDPAHPLPGR